MQTKQLTRLTDRLGRAYLWYHEAAPRAVDSSAYYIRVTRGRPAQDDSRLFKGICHSKTMQGYRQWLTYSLRTKDPVYD